MNTSANESPRLICRVVRWWATLTESSAPAPRSEPTAGHRAHCPACRAYFQSTAALETQLRQAARTQISAAPTGLEQRIVDAVRLAQVPARAPQRRAVPLWAAGLTTAAAAVALVVVLNRESPRASTSAEIAPVEIDALFTAVTTFPQQLNKVFVPADSQLVERDPLSQELDNVKADARSALSFLAENFLPAARPAPTSSLRDRQPAVQGG